MPMPVGNLFGAIQEICQRYADKGWGKFLREKFALDITKKGRELAVELTRDLGDLISKTKNVKGFENISPKVRRAIERSDPARSLLYHAFASAQAQDPSLTAYPTLAELEVLENFVYVASTTADLNRGAAPVNPPSLAELEQLGMNRGNINSSLAIVVFSHDYRPASSTPHQIHDDICFSRTGVARVGDTAAIYNPRVRGYWPADEKDPHNICVLPAQYSPYLAIRLPGSAAGSFTILPRLRDTDGDDGTRSFWVPIHKLFAGSECLRGQALSVAFEASHMNEKLGRMHRFLINNGIQTGFNSRQKELDKKPFVLSDGLAELSKDPKDCTGLLVPVAQPFVARAKNAEGKEMSFVVPSLPGGINGELRQGDVSLKLFDSSLQIRSVNREDEGARRAPEYAHIRDDIDAKQGDLNKKRGMMLAGKEGYILREGREAFHYTDGTADGWVAVKIPELKLESFPAYSLVTAPDFYPLVNQYDIGKWSQGNQLVKELRSALTNAGVDLREIVDGNRDDKGSRSDDIDRTLKQVWETAPTSLSDERWPPNLELAAFRESKLDDTVSAVISLPKRGDRIPISSISTIKRHTSLPDTAAGIFAPGWDISLGKTKAGDFHLSAYGLGSPFPEDSKLCAALSTFWPAAAPDATRTFLLRRKTVVPMLDKEITGPNAWDGVEGPRIDLTIPDKPAVIYPDINFADYVFNARDKKFSLAETSPVTFAEYTRRIFVMKFARLLVKANKEVNPELISFSLDPGADRTYRLHFATIDRAKQAHTGDHRFIRAPISNIFTLTIDSKNVVKRFDGIVPATLAPASTGGMFGRKENGGISSVPTAAVARDPRLGLERVRSRL